MCKIQCMSTQNDRSMILIVLSYQVPLDYNDAGAGSAAIALIKLPSAYNATNTQYRGPLIIGPGIYFDPYIVYDSQRL